MEAIISWSIGIILAIVFAIIINKMGDIYLNKGWADKDTLKVDSPKFRIESVKRVVGCNDHWVAEYKATSWYRTKKDVSSLTITFYDEIDKYNIDDELELFKV